MLDSILSLEETVLEGVLGEVVRSKRIVSVERFDDVGFLLLDSELFLVDTSLVVLIHVEEIGILVHVLTGSLLLDGSGLSLSLLVVDLDL